MQEEDCSLHTVVEDEPPVDAQVVHAIADKLAAAMAACSTSGDAAAPAVQQRLQLLMQLFQACSEPTCMRLPKHATLLHAALPLCMPWQPVVWPPGCKGS